MMTINLRPAEDQKRYLRRQEMKRASNAARYQREKQDPARMEVRRARGAAWWRSNSDSKAEAVCRRLRAVYGISLLRYEEMLREQGGGCAVCGAMHKEKRLHVDHCHATGVVRGLLCVKCNFALGYADDSEGRLLKLAEYLKKHSPTGERDN